MYEEIVKKYYTALLNYCQYKLNGNESAAKDVTQEVFFALYKKLGTLKMNTDIKYWLYRAADLEIKTYIRKNPSYTPIDGYEEIIADNTEPYIEDVKFDCLNSEEMSLLSEYYNSDDKESIAKKHKLNMNTLYIRIHRIRKKLEFDLNKKHKLL